MVADEVRRISDRKNAALVEACVSGEIGAVEEEFAKDTWQMPPAMEPFVGRDAIRDFWSQAVTWGDWQFSLDTQDVVVSPPIAVERGTYTLGFEAGPDAPPDMGSFQDHGCRPYASGASSLTYGWKTSSGGRCHLCTRRLRRRPMSGVTCRW